MADCHFANFDVVVQGQALPHMVYATYGAATAEAPLTVDSRQLPWPQWLARLAGADGAAGAGFIEMAGAALFQALFAAHVRDLWVHARGDLDRGSVDGLRIRLSFTAPDVAALPWELLYDPDRRLWFAASSKTPVVRTEQQLRHVGAPRTLAAQLPLRVLVVIPDDPTGQIDGPAEWQRIQQALAPVSPAGIHLEQRSGRLSLVEIRQLVERMRPDVLHLITHGQLGGLVLWQNERPQLASADAVRVALDAASSLRLIVLNACSTGAAASLTPLSSLAEHLLQTGLPAVLGMQFAINTDAAAQFAGDFYTELVAGSCSGAVDVAVNYARSNLYALNPDGADFGTPVLWLNTDNGRIFTPDRRIAVQPRQAAPPPLSPAELALLHARKADHEQWLAGLPSLDVLRQNASFRALEGAWRSDRQTMEDLLARCICLDEEAPSAELVARCRNSLDGVDRHRAALERILAGVSGQAGRYSS